MSIKQKFDLTGKVAIVTGSSKGIGLSIARGLAENGAKLVISSRKQDAVDIIAEEFNKVGLEATGIACHIGDAAQREALVAKTIEKHGRIDILVNNAAINPFYGPLETSGEEVFDKIMNVNVKAPWLLSNLVQPYMKENGSGSIINISSVEGLKASGNNLSYSASKYAVVGMTKSAALEYGHKNIRINAVCPGYTNSALLDQLLSTRDDMEEILKRYVPMRRFGEANEIAEGICWLASENSKFITGQTITLDGGASL
ncbi:UNVERIFIED_CONTAM: hypothetical protein GTU68_018375 [Idotea baltica]|nr:hypothetical protein [Idotea baltica]